MSMTAARVTMEAGRLWLFQQRAAAEITESDFCAGVTSEDVITKTVNVMANEKADVR